ncbi:MAG: substrate-binding domain-containing protein [Candidatus Puniceispirillaceae bacterium]
MALTGISGGLNMAMAGDFLILQSTTSTQNSGLYDYLLPIYQQKTGIEVRVVAVGTGQALNNARNCDGDILITHAKEAEEAFITAGYGKSREKLMYNDFVLIGPKIDPAGLKEAKTLKEALGALVQTQAPFLSRGDESGTDKAEKKLWHKHGFRPADFPRWYLETGQGMGASLTIALEVEGYILSDRATWLARNYTDSHEVVFSNAPDLFNQYGLIRLDPAHCPHIRHDIANQFADWLISAEGQVAIAGFNKNGAQLFFPNAD